ncbi:MAG: riboflavin kinase [Elusimicrobia bacterium]|nr:riboflavin kinase [Elusimicrobiota bacterium]
MRPAVLRGTVVRGDGRGRQLGFPTANIDVGAAKTPEHGVYAVEVEAEGLKYRAVCNIGVRPSISGSQGVHVEVHIPGFEGDLYGKTLSLRILRKLRGEKKFGSLDELKAQIARDIASLSDAP